MGNNTDNNIYDGPRGLTGDEGAQGAQGAQGRTGARGAKGAQGAQGAQGFPGNVGATGVQGKRGMVGVQGIQGRAGMMGPAGNMGTQGAQGMQGITGIQGVQGNAGSKGPQGVQGVQGAPGAQGVRGTAGPQGIRGCSGPQGSTGSAGVQGPQGRRGENGAQGTRGCAGPQGTRGVQGSTGPQGPKGYMGYRGPDGAAGVQGVEGREGAVWYDGVRLDGYNTHLFHFDINQGKFVSPEGQNNYLELREGAFIRLWIDQDGLDAIMADSEILIDETIIEEGAETIIRTTDYRAYFNGDELISSKLSDDNLNTVIEFTFHRNRWVYSGGSIGADEPELSSRIEVIGTEIGDYHDGDIIPAGTLMEDVLRTLLTHTIDVYAVEPQLSLVVLVNGDETSGNIDIEIGTPITLSVRTDFTDGRFIGEEGYDYNVAAGCELGDIEWSVNGEPIVGDEYTTVMGAEGISVQAKVNYSASTVVPVKNTGVPSDVHIDSGVKTSSTIVLSGVEAGYYDIVTKITASSFDNPDKYPVKSQDDLGENGNVKLKVTLKNNRGVINRIESTEEKPSFALAIPSGYRIVQTKNSNGEDVVGSDWDDEHAGTWFKQNSIEYHNDERHLIYNVWVILSTGVTEYKDIIISR